MKICLAASKGGHYFQMQELTKKINFEKFQSFFLTFQREDIEVNPNTYFVTDPKRNPFRFFLNFLQSLRVMLKERPEIIISTGAGVTILPCYIVKLLGGKVIYIESFSRGWNPSVSGRIIYPIADLFFVQWEELKSKYPKAIFAGRLR